MHDSRQPDADTNAIIGALLHDLAALQESKQSEMGYQRAASTILRLDEPLESYLLPDGTLRKIQNIGPKSETVILEVLRSGTSPTVDKAVSQSAKRTEVERSRGLRGRFLSRAAVVAVLRDTTLGGPSLGDVHGDLQMHSTWSDGSQSLEEIVTAGLERGYGFCGVTDHSHGLRIARGMSMEDVAKQHAEIDRVNRAHRGRFRLIKGMEANITADGSVDVAREDRKRLELVLAAPHAVLRSADDQTARMIRAVEEPGVHILAHPTGRQYGTRAGIIADWDAVFAAATRADVAVEIDGDPSRQDVNYELAERAMAAGCLFSLDSDAHATRELMYAEIALAHARLAGIPRDRVINCWPLERLLHWLETRR
jgi:histidinol phosphatase-like PHP family hydrolase